MTDPTKPLTGIRVLDLTNVLAGPFACHQLAHLGAEVIKVETVDRGDLARQLGADPALNAKGMGVSFLAQNAGKKSVTLNLKHARGKQLLKELVKTADVLVENFRPGVMDRLALGPDVLRAENPALIYCAISGFGQDGPWVARPAYDQIIQGLSGIMSITGDGDSAPLRVGYPIADTIGGLTAAMAILAALNAPVRGAVIDVSMLEAVLATMGWAVSNHLIAGVAPTANGNENLTSAPSGTFHCQGGLINIAANKDEQWEILATDLGLAHLITDPAYLTREDRKANRYALRDLIEGQLAHQTVNDWADQLNALGIPCGAVLSVPEVLDHPQIADRGLVAEFDDVPGVDRPVRVLRPGLKIDGAPARVENGPPELGQDNAAIYGALGLDAAELIKLKKEGVI
jgi:crotonobetainyl-CoA:carnitine CoA-transferase CaiB-like acyl-CoA transferase